MRKQSTRTVNKQQPPTTNKRTTNRVTTNRNKSNNHSENTTKFTGSYHSQQESGQKAYIEPNWTEVTRVYTQRKVWSVW